MSQRRLCSLLAFAVLATCALQPNAAVQVAQRSSGGVSASAALAAAHVHAATAGGRHVRSIQPSSPSSRTATRAAGDPQDRRRLLAGAAPPPLSPPSQGAPALAAQQLYAAAESFPAAKVMKPSESMLGTGIPFLHLTYHLVGPDLLPVTPRLKDAMQRSLDSAFSLFQFTMVVQSVKPLAAANSTVVPAAALTGNGTAAAVSTFSSGSTGGLAGAPGAGTPAAAAATPGAHGRRPSSARPPARKLLQGRLNTSPSARGQYEGVEVVAMAYVTTASVFETLGERRQSQQLQGLAQSASTFGYQVRFLPQDASFTQATVVLSLRLPRSFQNFRSTTYKIDCKFVGRNVAPVTAEAQNALAVAVSSVPNWFYGEMTQLQRTADNSAAVATFTATTGNANGTVSPQDVLAVINPRIQQYFAASGANGTVTVDVQYAQLPPFQVPSDAFNITLATVPLPGYNATTPAASSISAGAIAGIVVGVVAVMASLLVIIAIFMWHRRRLYIDSHGDGGGRDDGLGAFDQKLMGWAIQHEDIEICTHADGTEWLLGEGAYGRVYKALRGGVQDVAVKQLSHTGDGQLQKFIEEVGILKGLNYDRNIVQFYGACVREGCEPLLVTEYMEGGDLCSAIQGDTGGHLLWYGLGHRIALDIARGLYFLHSHEVVHSDMKSKNVLLNSAMHAKISDVGLAQLIEAQTEQSAVLAWTLAYAAPEVLMNEKRELKSDMYSFGILLWEIVTGTIPYTRGKLPTPETPRDCPADIWDLIQQCLLLKPDERPSAKQCFRRIHESCRAFNLLCTTSWSSGPPPASIDASSNESAAAGADPHAKSMGSGLQTAWHPSRLSTSSQHTPAQAGRSSGGGGLAPGANAAATATAAPSAAGLAGGNSAAAFGTTVAPAAHQAAGDCPVVVANTSLAQRPANPFASAVDEAWSGTWPADEADGPPESVRSKSARLLTVGDAAEQVALSRRVSLEGRKASLQSGLSGARQPARFGKPPITKVQSDPTAGVAAADRSGSTDMCHHASVGFNRTSYGESTGSSHAALVGGLVGKGSADLAGGLPGRVSMEVPNRGSMDLYSCFA